MSTDRTDRPRDAQGAGARPPHGEGHQPLPGENPPQGEGARRKHVQNADLPPGQGHQPLPGEDPPDKKRKQDEQ